MSEDPDSHTPSGGTGGARGGAGRTPEIDAREVRRGRHPGDRYVRVIHDPKFQRVGPGVLSATPQAGEPTTGMGRAINRLKRVVVGPPISTAQQHHERLTKLKALAVLSSDALSSVAYGPEEIVTILIAAGAAGLAFSMPIAVAIVLLMIIVGTSYRQTIKAYPKGGGSYIVASDNLGTIPGLMAGAALTVGYILTVAVSISSGVAAILSAVPSLLPYRVEIAVGVILFIMLANLRGIRESGNIFMLPTYVFLALMYALIGVGLYHVVTGTVTPLSPGAFETRGTELMRNISLFLILRAFAQGCSAMTGTEAISDGVPAFKPPEWKNARTTLTAMVVLLTTTFFGTTFLLHQYAVVPSPNGTPTMVSKLAETLFGDTPLYYAVQVFTALILILAANTSFSDFPRLHYFMARDRFVPHQFEFRGDRLAYSNGIIVLGLVSSLLVIGFKGDVSALIPLYAVGVFLAFTMSQSGMVVRWWRRREPGWRHSIVINALGAATTALVTVIEAVTQFTHGAWLVVLILPVLILGYLGIHRHYERAGRELEPETPLRTSEIKHSVIVPVAALNRVAIQTLAYAKSIAPNVTAVHVAETDEDVEEFQRRWKMAEEKYGDLGNLVVLVSPYRAVVGPILAFIDAVDRKEPDDTITVVLPEFIAKHWWEIPLHNQTALRLKGALLFRKGTVVVSVPYHLST